MNSDTDGRDAGNIAQLASRAKPWNTFEAEYPFLQFMISRSLGRVVGFIDENRVFQIIALDPRHNIQNREVTRVVEVTSGITIGGGNRETTSPLRCPLEHRTTRSSSFPPVEG